MFNEVVNLLESITSSPYLLSIFEGELFPFLVVGLFFTMLGLTYRVSIYTQKKYKKYRNRRAIRMLDEGDMVIYKKDDDSFFGLIEKKTNEKLDLVEPFSWKRTTIKLSQLQTIIPKKFYEEKRFSHQLKKIWSKYNFETKDLYTPYTFLEIKLIEEEEKELERKHLHLEVGHYYKCTTIGNDEVWLLVIGRIAGNQFQDGKTRTYFLKNPHGFAELVSNEAVSYVEKDSKTRAAPMGKAWLEAIFNKEVHGYLENKVYGVDYSTRSNILYLRTGEEDTSWWIVDANEFIKEEEKEEKKEYECYCL